MQGDPVEATVLTTRSIALKRDGRLFAALPDLKVAQGQSVAILGASGSGKTTALLALAGIRAPAGGEVVVENTAVWALSAAARDRFRGQRIGLVFQSFYLVDALSVAANLTLAARCAGLPADASRVDHLLASLSISELRAKRADRISQGQAQRVAVARALFNRPAVILADEPTSSLDDVSTSRLLALLKASAANEGAGLVIATHDRRVVEFVDQAFELQSLS